MAILPYIMYCTCPYVGRWVVQKKPKHPHLRKDGPTQCNGAKIVMNYDVYSNLVQLGPSSYLLPKCVTNA